MNDLFANRTIRMDLRSVANAAKHGKRIICRRGIVDGWAIITGPQRDWISNIAARLLRVHGCLTKLDKRGPLSIDTVYAIDAERALELLVRCREYSGRNT